MISGTIPATLEDAQETPSSHNSWAWKELAASCVFSLGAEVSQAIGLRQIEWRGRAVYAFERIEGRCGGDFKHGERVSYHDICDAVGEVFPGCAFNVQNTGGLVIEIGAESVLPGQKKELLMALVKRVPDVRQMIDSGLAGEIPIRGTGQPTSPRTAKRVLRPA